MVKDDTILLLGALGVGGFLLSRAGLFKGVGEASEGVGQGIGQAVTSAGDVVRDVERLVYVTGAETGEAVGEFGDLADPFGSFGRGSSSLIETLLKNARDRSNREFSQADIRDRQKEPFKLSRSRTRQKALTEINQRVSEGATGFFRTFLPTPEEGQSRRTRAKNVFTNIISEIKNRPKKLFNKFIGFFGNRGR